MITSAHIKIYKFYVDGDYFVRMSSEEEKKIMTYKDWLMIENFIQDLLLVKRGKASKYFAEQLSIKLKNNCENQKVIISLENMAEQKSS